MPNTDTEVKNHTKQYVYVLKSRMLTLNLVITACQILIQKLNIIQNSIIYNEINNVGRYNDSDSKLS